MDDWNLVRHEFEMILMGPGVTWNKHGILQAFDKALASAAIQRLDELKKKVLNG